MCINGTQDQQVIQLFEVNKNIEKNHLRFLSGQLQIKLVAMI